MGTQPLGLKLTRRIAREVGEPIKRAVGHGGYEFEFVTFEHEHGWWNKKSGLWVLEGPEGNDGRGPMHWMSCRWNFNGEPVPDDLCGATATLLALDLLCTEPVHAPEPGCAYVKHRCGSEVWWTDASAWYADGSGPAYAEHPRAFAESVPR